MTTLWYMYLSLDIHKHTNLHNYLLSTTLINNSLYYNRQKGTIGFIPKYMER